MIGWLDSSSHIRYGCAVEPSHKAIHLRTGDRGTDGAISTWLDCHDVEVVTCADSFDACVQALTELASAPDLALIGIDWLPPDEYSIIHYLRETWPGLTMVLYGSTPMIVEFGKMPLTIACRGAADIRRMLASTPGALVKQSHAALPAQSTSSEQWLPRPAESAQFAEAPPLEAPPTQPAKIITKRADTTGAVPSHQVGEPDADSAMTSRPPITQAILTREELAALLEDDKK